MAPAQSAEFTRATTDVKKFTKDPSQDDLLQFYAYFKQGTQSPPFADAPQPGMFDLKGKAKYNAWSKVANEGTSATEAQKKYVQLFESLKGPCAYKA
ncbi:hypothetical protein MMC09_006658 [Bachmanniomyces sp. S44760]|nr:hypothetical protein [Bachmanniomyces sp. S44760]